MTSEGLGEMFEGDSADTCARKFSLMLMGGRANSQVCADGERGPPSALAEIVSILIFNSLGWPAKTEKSLKINPRFHVGLI